MSLAPLNSSETLKVGGGAYLVELDDPTDFQSPLIVRRIKIDGILESASDEKNDVTVEEVAVVKLSLGCLASGGKCDTRPTSMLFTATALREVVANAEDPDKPDLKNYSLSAAIYNRGSNMKIASYLVIAEFQRELKKLPTIEDEDKNPQSPDRPTNKHI